MFLSGYRSGYCYKSNVFAFLGKSCLSKSFSNSSEIGCSYLFCNNFTEKGLTIVFISFVSSFSLNFTELFFVKLANFALKVVKYISTFCSFWFLTVIPKCISPIKLDIFVVSIELHISRSKWIIKSSSYFWFSFSDMKTGILFCIIILLNNNLQSSSLLLLMWKS